MSLTLENALVKEFGPGVSVVGRRPTSGGDINTAAVLSLSSGVTIFIKENRLDLEPMFVAEAAGLRALAAASEQSLSVPRVIAAGASGNRSFLLLEEIPRGRLRSGSEFGAALAELHRSGRRDSCGFDADNWIGSTPQRNPWTAGWHEFFAEHRLGFQWDLARQNGYGDGSLDKEMASIQGRLPLLLPEVDENRPSLLHGDLWGGNWMADTDGRPWIIDPAAYYGHREADIAMTRLFGGFPPGFHSGYQEHWPLEAGFDERVHLYNLYHLLNHLNLFGSSYWGAVRDILKKFG